MSKPPYMLIDTSSLLNDYTVISLLLGATLSWAIVGATSLIGVLVACCVLVGLHRLMAWASVRNPAFRWLINGNSQLV